MFLYDDLCRLFHFLQFQFSLTSSPLHRIDLPLQCVSYGWVYFSNLSG